MSWPFGGAPRLLLRAGWWCRRRLCRLLLWSETHSTKGIFHGPAIHVTCAYCDHFQSALFNAQWFTCWHVIAFTPNRLIKKMKNNAPASFDNSNIFVSLTLTSFNMLNWRILYVRLWYDTHILMKFYKSKKQNLFCKSIDKMDSLYSFCKFHSV